MKLVHLISAMTLLVVVYVVVRGNDAVIIGQLITSGIVTVNDKKAVNGASIFNNSRIKVQCTRGGAIINLDRLGRIELSPGAEMTLSFSDQLISGTLDQGNITVKAESGVMVSIATHQGITTTSAQNKIQVVPISAQRGIRCSPIAITGLGSPAFGPFGMALVGLGVGGAGLAGSMAIDQDTPSVKVAPQASNTVP